jgi:hypothetical protein
MKDIKLRDGDILVFKRDKHSYNTLDRIIESVIQFGTRCRYFHTATYYKDRIYQSTFTQGVYSQTVDKEGLELLIKLNQIDVFRQDHFNEYLFDKRVKNVIGSAYDYASAVLSGLDSLLNREFFKYDAKNRYFCSELTSYLHNLKLDKSWWRTTPCDIAHSNKLTRVY